MHTLGHLVLLLGLLALLARHPAYPRLIRQGAGRSWPGLGLLAACLMLIQASLSLRIWPHLPLLFGYLAGLPAALWTGLLMAPCLLGLGTPGSQVLCFFAMGPLGALLRPLPIRLGWPVLALITGAWVPLSFQQGWVPQSVLLYLQPLSPTQWGVARAMMTLVSALVTPVVLHWATYLAGQEERSRALAAAAVLRQQLAHQQAVLQETRFRFLAAQIKPHFLFNSLTAVAGLILKEPEKAHDVVVELAEFLRPAFQARPDRIPLQEELRTVRAYLNVEQARLGERLTCSIETEAGTEEGLLPSFVIQPLVENAVRHGLAAQTRGGRLSIRVSRRAELLHICVEDDGVGFHQPVSGPFSTSDPAGVGLLNVRERLECSGGPGAGLQLQSAPGQGTRVTIWLPYATDPLPG
ncbi:MAG: histidine kinase [Candidatus Eremiobacteraeota bacterium]|nr:histidine kinase [Candidatus Eremiobacteraeota bacterium]MCW5867684.1 histidine kinase [Candidatus Eremiobacteraeota bacterium]